MAEINLGDEGLSNGDDITPYINEHFRAGNDVIIPQGTYQFSDGFDVDISGGNASLQGQGTATVGGSGGVVLESSGSTQSWIRASGGATVTVGNLTVKGRASDASAWIGVPESGSKVIFDRIFKPDGGAGRAFQTRHHTGDVVIRNCYAHGFADNGIVYGDKNGEVEGANSEGTILVENCYSHNNNISGIRVAGTATVRNCLIKNESVPDVDHTINMRGLWLSEAANLTVQNLNVVYTGGAGGGGAIEFQEPEAEGSQGSLHDVFIKNNTDTKIINEEVPVASNFDVDNFNVTGSGNMDLDGFDSKSGIRTGSSAKQPDTSSPIQGFRDTSLDGPFELRISNETSSVINYDFTVEGSIKPITGSGDWAADLDAAPVDSVSNDPNTGTATASGAVAGPPSSGDAFRVDGNVTKFNAPNTVVLYANGVRVGPQELINKTKPDEPKQPKDPQPTTYDLTAKAVNADGGALTANATVGDTTKQTPATFTLEEGSYTVQFNKEGYNAVSKDVTLDANKTVTATLQESTQSIGDVIRNNKGAVALGSLALISTKAARDMQK